MSSEIILQNGAGAFLRRDGKFLLLKRAATRIIAPNVWSCVGGHMEPHEINDPRTACLREIYEETGISAEHIFNLELRYVIIRRFMNTIRQNYIYFGDTDISDVRDTREGVLHWIDQGELLNREYTKTYAAMMEHYAKTPDRDGRVVVGVAGRNGDSLVMNWSIVEDFE